MARPQSHRALACLSLLILLLLPGATAASYSSLCRSPAPAPDLPRDHYRSRITRRALPQISTGHFSGERNLHFAPDQSGIPRSFSFYTRRSARTTDPAVLHLSATLTLLGTHWRRYDRLYSVSFDLEGYYSTATSPAELCMVGSGSYAREDGFGVVVLPDVMLRLHVPHPSNLTHPFVTGRLEGAEFGVVTLVAYANGDYEFGDTASCTAPPGPVRDAPQVRHVKFLRHRVKALLRGSYSVEYGLGGHAASGFPLQPRHQRMYFNQVRCTRNATRLRAYMVFETDNTSAVRRYNYTVQLPDGLSVGDEALVAEGVWNQSRREFCLRACRVVRSGPSRADLAVRECGIGVSIWFPTVWSVRDRSVVAGMIWNTSRTSNSDTGKTSGVISLSRTGSYSDYISYIKYNYTRVEEAKKHYIPKPVLSNEKKGRFPGNYSYQDFAFGFYRKKHGFYGYASPVTIGSALVQGDRLMADAAFYGNWTSEMKKHWLMNVSYDLQFHVPYLNSSADISHRMFRKKPISAEGVYDTTTGSMVMVACQAVENNGSSDCEILVTAQFAPLDAEATERVMGTISSLRKQSDPLFFEAQDFYAEGMYMVHIAVENSRMDMERIMLVISMTLSCVFTALQLRHVRKHPEALQATSITMLAVLAVGYAVPLVLNLEAMLTDDSRDNNKHFVRLTSAGSLELNEFMLRFSTMLAFVLQLRFLQLALSRRHTGRRRQTSRGLVIRPREEHALDMPAAVPPRRRPGYAGLVLDGFLLPQVVWNAFAGSKVRALSPWFYAGGSAVRAAPHVYDVFRRHNYVPSWAASYVYASPRDDLFGVAWDVAVPCGAALLAALLFLQQRLGGAFLCCVGSRRPGEYEMASTVSS
ncbi:hypothetical protein EJB05_17419, partial [Eragrostis curvula]